MVIRIKLTNLFDYDMIFNMCLIYKTNHNMNISSTRYDSESFRSQTTVLSAREIHVYSVHTDTDKVCFNWLKFMTKY